MAWRAMVLAAVLLVGAGCAGSGKPPRDVGDVEAVTWRRVSEEPLVFYPEGLAEGAGTSSFYGEWVHLGAGGGSE